MKKGPITTTIVELTQLDTETLEYRRRLAKIARAQLAAEKKIAAIKSELDEETGADVKEAAAIFENIQSFAVLNKERLFTDIKSLDLAAARIGFRTSPPSIKQVRGVQAAHSLARLKSLSGDKYVRTVEEINKEALLADQKELGPAYFASAGLFVHQEEKFYMDLLSEVLKQQTESIAK